MYLQNCEGCDDEEEQKVEEVVEELGEVVEEAEVEEPSNKKQNEQVTLYKGFISLITWTSPAHLISSATHLSLSGLPSVWSIKFFANQLYDALRRI